MKNYETLSNELGFREDGITFSIPEYRNVIQVVSNGGTSVDLVFYAWEDPALPKTSYRIPIVTKELFKLYFGSDANLVFNYFETGDAPETFKANGFNVRIVQADGSTSLWLRK